MASWLRITPRHWRTDVTVRSRQGRDRNGVLTSATPRTLTDVMVTPGAAVEGAAAPGAGSPPSQATADAATLYAPPGTTVASTDQVTVPPTHPLAGVWDVIGDPSPWPKGVVVNLSRRG